MSDSTNLQELSKDSINLVRVLNPFRPSEQIVERREWLEPAPLSSIIPAIECEHVYSVNGGVVAPENYGAVIVHPGDVVVSCPVLRGGGGGGKSILRTVAMVAVAVAAVYTGQVWLAGGGSMFGAAVASSVVAIGGSMLVNAILPPPGLPSLGRLEGPDSRSDSTYGADGAKNVSVEGAIVPVIYGAHRTGGNLISSRTAMDGETQYLYLLFAMSEGDVAGIDDIKLNDTELSRFNNVWVQTRNGFNNEQPIDWFNDNELLVQKGIKLSNGFWAYHTTEGEIDAFKLNIVMPEGIWRIDKSNGNRLSHAVAMEAEYRRVGAADWCRLSGNASAAVRKRSVVPHEVFEVRYQETFNNYNNGGRGGTHTSTVVYKVFKSFRYVDNGQIVTNPDDLRQIRAIAYELAKPKRGQLPGFWGMAAFNGASLLYDGKPIPGAKLGPGDYFFAVNSPVQAPNWFNMGAVDIDVYDSAFKIEDSKRSTIRKQWASPPLAKGRYEIRIRRTDADSDSDVVGDTILLNEVAEVIADDVAHINTALLALKIKMDEQISGLPQVSAVVAGKVVMVYDYRSGQWSRLWSNNPAWILLDMLTNRRYGAGMGMDRINLDSFSEWAEHCTSENLTFDGVINGGMNLWDAAKMVLRCGHAQLVRSGTRYTIAIERKQDPIMVFNVGNIIKDSFSEEWLPVNDRANEIELTYYDREDNYKPRTIRLIDEAAALKGEPQRTSSLTMPGIVTRERAMREARLMLNMNRFLRQTVTFRASIDAIACTVGDVVLVQHDQPEWGDGGRMKPGSTRSTVKLDRPVTLESGADYKLLTVMPAVKMGEGVVLSKTSTNVVIRGSMPAGANRLVVAGGADLQIRSTYRVDGASYGVVVDSTDRVGVGAAVALWCSDMIVERRVSTRGTDVADIMLSEPLPADPDPFLTWTIGKYGRRYKPFRITAISGSGMEERTISAIEYNETVYTNSPSEQGGFSSLPTGIEQSIITSVSEALVRVGSGLQVNVTVEFENRATNYARSHVQVSVDGGPFQTVGEGLDRVTFQAIQGQRLRIRAIAMSMLGVNAPADKAKLTEYLVRGKDFPPANVRGFEIKRRPYDLLMTWEPNDDLDLGGYEVREGNSWDAGRIIVSEYQGTMHVTDKSEAGIYYYHVRAYDTSGNWSVAPTTFKLVLDAPSAVREFDAVQNADMITMSWRPNPEIDIVGYEIREGEEWGRSTLVATGITNNRYSLQSAGNAKRRFLIKAIVSPGVYSDSATFVDLDTDDGQFRNLILTIDEHANGYGGRMTNLEFDPSTKGLRLIDDARYGEYIFGIGLVQPIRARNVASYTLGARQQDDATWGSVNWTWLSPESGRPWEKDGNFESVSSDIQIATRLDKPKMDGGVIDRWTFDGTTTSVSGKAPYKQASIGFAKGKFTNGVKLTPFSSLQLSQALPAVFSVKFWFKPEGSTDLQYVWRAEGQGIRLELVHRVADKTFVLRDGHPENDITVQLDYSTLTYLLIGVVQGEEWRRLMVGSPERGGTMAAGKVKALPQGQFTRTQVG